MVPEPRPAPDPKKIHHLAAWFLSALLAIVFISVGLVKLVAHESAVAQFRAWGYPLWFMHLIGALEIAAGVLLLVPRAASYASAYLLVEMVGSVITFVVNAQWLLLLLPLAFGAALAYVAWARLPDAMGIEARTHPMRQ